MMTICIAGPPRSGTTLLASLLDGHPDIVVWPTEWLFHTSFWLSLPGPAARRRVSDVTAAAMPVFEKIGQPVASDRYGVEFRNSGAFDLGVFLHEMSRHPDKMVSADEYLTLMGAAFARAQAKYARHAPKYFVIKTMMSGIDWSIAGPDSRTRILWMNRPIEDSYRSQRAKFFEMKADRSVGEIRRMYHFFRDQCFALLYAAKQAVDVERALRQWPTAQIVDLRRVRSDSRAVMESVAAFLEIPFSPSLVEPTFFGEAYAGHFHDRNLNVGRIVDADSPHPEPTPVERYFLDRLKRAAETGKRREPTESFAGWWRALCDTVRTLPARHSLFSGLTVVHMVAVSWRMWRLRRRDLSTAAYDAALVYRPPRGIKTRLMKRFARA